MNPLAGKPLDYIIGQDNAPLRPGRVLELGYDAGQAPGELCIKYGNLFDEKNAGKLGPYRHKSDTAQEYNEGEIDPDGPGWWENINQQIERALTTGWRWIEWDNPDAYTVDVVIPVYDRTLKAGLRVIAKNPLLVPGQPHLLLSHPAVDGAIVEKGAGTARLMRELRDKAGKPDLPVWFVSFGSGRSWALERAREVAA